MDRREEGTMDMPTNNNSFPSVTDLTWAVIAVLGGIANYLDGFLKGKQTPAWSRITAHAFVSGFSGYMVAQVILLVRPEWAFVSAGVAGYLGTQALDLFADILKKRAKDALDVDATKDK